MKIDNIKKQYTKKLNDKIYKYKNIIIDSFVEFYGEKNRIIITERFNNIEFLYYINDLTIFYIVEELKGGYKDKFKNILFAIPYIIYLVQNDLWKKKVTKDNFCDLGINKIVGFSNEDIFEDIELLKCYIGIALRENNESPYYISLDINNDIKRVVALPIFSVDDKSFFHELNHAICSELIIKNDERIIKCGLNYSNESKSYVNEIINDIISLEIYNIFKSKCCETIFDDNIMEDVLIDEYDNYHHLVNEFYEENKEKIKLSSINHSAFQIKRDELELLSEVIENCKIKKEIL